MPPFDLSTSSDSSMDGIDLPSFHAPEYPTEDSNDDGFPVGAIAPYTQMVQCTVIASSE